MLFAERAKHKANYLRGIAEKGWVAAPLSDALTWHRRSGAVKERRRRRMTQDSDANEQEVADLRLFEEARRALQSFTATKEELSWRITHHQKIADKTRKAIENSHLLPHR